MDKNTTMTEQEWEAEITQYEEMEYGRISIESDYYDKMITIQMAHQ